jgi:glutamate N-acetyltransferase/amino-acid N-acetyltransferase
MPVNYTPRRPEELLPVRGVALGTAAARIKNWSRDDLLLIALAPGSEAAGVFTRNRFCAAPVTVCRAHLARRDAVRALVVNAGNANAGTGAKGLIDAQALCAAVGAAVDCEAHQVLPFSTGVIMEPLPIERMLAAIPVCRSNLGPDHWAVAARAIMTTDTAPKAASRRVRAGGVELTMTGIAKGSGMIAPSMATLLAFVATDAPLSRRLLDELAPEVAAQSFNRITVDGDTSTNDSFVLAATHAEAMAPIERRDDPRFAPVRDALAEIAVELAQAIVRDGEGATKFIALVVEGGRDAAECDRVARSIAHSPLVKTAFFASDPNLGRILSAIGNAVADLDPMRVSFWLDEVLVVADGSRAESYREEDGRRVMAKPEIAVRVALGRGKASTTLWTCDLSHEYVSINADYRS